MAKKLLNIYDDALYIDIQVWCKKNKTDANVFINDAMKEKMDLIDKKVQPSEDPIVKAEEYFESVSEVKNDEIEITILVEYLSGVIHLTDDFDSKKDYSNYLTDKYK